MIISINKRKRSQCPEHTHLFGMMNERERIEKLSTKSILRPNSHQNCSQFELDTQTVQSHSIDSQPYISEIYTLQPNGQIKRRVEEAKPPKETAKGKSRYPTIQCFCDKEKEKKKKHNSNTVGSKTGQIHSRPNQKRQRKGNSENPKR